ncbi:hypothetical protein D3870_03170 [Noviherbaspirillum cavernae]|uniref:FimV N-terminal domain-containing protein n=1 Tax=Noviherbaspirillum cavernae TaxID=2320862 RepID=A0A418WY44_9BURK|nr:FimV/HubP family polar landmark protein [Noviherbaspirillum cavernae]RJG05150.1 hypothetical protein D3870_03170 [Noviherbaspirillum cavernae]
MAFPLLRRVGWGAALAFLAPAAHAAGLGPVQVQSGLGEPLRAAITLVGNDTANFESRCIAAKVTSLDGAISITPAIRLVRSGQSASVLLTTREHINEPVLNVLVDMSCDTLVRREYQILLDPVAALPATAAMSQPASPQFPAAKAPRAAAPAAQAVATSASSESPAQPAARKRKTRKRNAAPVQARVRSVANGEAPAKARAKAAKAEQPVRSILKMSPIDIPADNAAAAAPLKPAEATPAGRDEAPLQKPATTPGEEVARIALAQMETLLAETRALRAETERVKKQYEQDKAAQEAMRNESLSWIKGLGVLLALCLGAMGWLLWRMRAMKMEASRTSWNELFADTTAATQLDGHTEFNTTEFSLTTINTSEIEAAGHVQSTFSPITESNTGFALPATGTFTPELSAPVAAPAAPGEAERSQPFKYVSGGSIPYVYSNQTETARARPEHALKVEEISDVMELAEAWMALHNPSKVLELLDPFNDTDQPKSPLPWLCLLDVYRSLGDREKFEAILARIKRIFNVKLRQWETPPGVPGPRALADFPHVRETILALWESDEVLPYLNSLVRDNRDGMREGFDLPAYRDILRLITIAGNPERQKRADRAMDPKAWEILFAAPSAARPHADADEDRMDALAEEPLHVARDTDPRTHGRTEYVAVPHQRIIEGRDADRHAVRATGSGASFAADALDELASHGLALAEPDSVVKTGDASPAFGSNKPDAARNLMSRDDMSPMAIKLHLAVAYQDIGDKEGACLLLEEVIQGGTEEQTEQAKSMLAALA